MRKKLSTQFFLIIFFLGNFAYYKFLNNHNMNDNELQQNKKIISVVSYFFFFFFTKKFFVHLEIFLFLSQFFNQSPSNWMITKLSFENCLSFFSLCANSLKLIKGICTVSCLLCSMINLRMMPRVYGSRLLFSREFFFSFFTKEEMR